MENSKKKSTRKKDSKNYRLVSQEEKTYEEKFSLKLSRSNVFLIGTFISLIIILFVVLLLFGGKKIPELMSGFGKGIKEFKKATKEEEKEESKDDSN